MGEEKEIVFGWERIADAFDEALPLMQRHNAEVNGQEPFEPDVDRYMNLESVGVLKCATLRRKGRLIGYASICIAPMIHHRSQALAVIDSLWIERSERRGLLGYNFILWLVAQLSIAGISKVDFSVAHGNVRLQALFSRLGFAPFETLMRLDLCPVAAT